MAADATSGAATASLAAARTASPDTRPTAQVNIVCAGGSASFTLTAAISCHCLAEAIASAVYKHEMEFASLCLPQVTAPGT